jgi:putative peptidoglycan lipid II flippase
MTERQRRLAWAAVIVAFATGLSRFVGVGREILTANAYGAGVAYSTFASVSVIPNLVRQLFADAAISAAFVPVFTGLFEKGERERAYRVASSLLSFMIVVVGSLVLLLVVVAPVIIHVFYSQLAASAYVDNLAVNMLRLLLPTVLLFSVSGVVIGVLYSFERFTMPALVSVVWNLVIIAFIVLFSSSSSLGIYALVLGTVVGTIAELLLLIGAVGRTEMKWKLAFAWRDPLMLRVLGLMVPVTITLGILNFNALVDFYFAQFVSDRAAGYINYAFRLYQLPQGMFAITIGTVLFPTLSRYALEADPARFRETLSLGVRQILFVSLPFVAWFVLMPDAIVRLIYQHGEFTAADTRQVAPVLAFFTLGMAFANANIMLNRGFQSRQRPLLPLYVGLVNLALNALLDWLLYPSLGAKGIVLSTSIVSAFNFVALLWLMRREIGLVDGRRMLKTLGRVLLCTLPLAIVSYGLWRALQGFADNGVFALLVSVLAAVGLGGLAYLGAAKLLKVEELGTALRLLRRQREPYPPPPDPDEGLA